MTRIVVCTTVYEEARPFLPDFAEGLLKATKKYPTEVVIVSHGLEGAEEALAAVIKNLHTTVIQAAHDLSPAAVRGIMLKSACETGSEVLVFTDADDALLPAGIEAHLDALDDADFSYGDQVLVDVDLTPIGKTLYQDWPVPARTSGPADLCDGNFVGFSGAAVRRSSLGAEAVAVPKNVVAVDWWFFTQLLVDGCRGGRTPIPVVSYRQHSGNVNGAIAAPQIPAVLKRCEAVLRHAEAFPHLRDLVVAVRRLARAIEDDAVGMAPLIREACSEPRFWYADIGHMIRRYAGIDEPKQWATGQ